MDEREEDGLREVGGGGEDLGGVDHLARVQHQAQVVRGQRLLEGALKVACKIEKKINFSHQNETDHSNIPNESWIDLLCTNQGQFTQQLRRQERLSRLADLELKH